MPYSLKFAVVPKKTFFFYPFVCVLSGIYPWDIAFQQEMFKNALEGVFKAVK